jgi:hypothetical protein
VKPTAHLHPMTRSLNYVYGRAIGEAVSRWLPTVAARVQSRGWSSGICGGQSAVGAGTIGQYVAAVPSGPSMDSTPHYAKTKLKLNSVVLARKRTIPTKRPQPADEVSANFS